MTEHPVWTRAFLRKQLFCLFLYYCILLFTHKWNLHIILHLSAPSKAFHPTFQPASLFKGNIYSLHAHFLVCLSLFIPLQSGFITHPSTDDQSPRWWATHHDRASVLLSVFIFIFQKHLAQVLDCYFSKTFLLQLLPPQLPDFFHNSLAFLLC